MATVRFSNFGGIAPGVAAGMLPENGALLAHNCRLMSGRLEPLREPRMDNRSVFFEGGLTDIVDARTIYLWHFGEKSEWIAWRGKVRVAPSNLALDSRKRLFVTGETGVDQADGDGVVHSNVPIMFVAETSGYSKHPIIKEKLGKPVVTYSDNLDDAKEIRYTYFFQTWVDEFGYESPLSVASDEVAYNDGMKLKVGEVLLGDVYNDAQLRRIYKVVTGTDGESIQFIGEQERSGRRFLDFYFSFSDENAGEVEPKIEAPSWRLDDLLWMPGGFYAGVDRSDGRTVCFSEVNMPYSWPSAYRYAVKDDIVGIGLVGNTLVVLTEGSPWVVSGTAPEAMSVSSLSSPYACVSAESICTLGGTLFYASHGGIYGISEGSTSVQPVTKGWWTSEAWEKLRPETCRMVAHDHALFLWFTDGDGLTHGYVVDFLAGGGIKAVTTHDEPAGALFEDVANGALCYVRKGA